MLTRRHTLKLAAAGLAVAATPAFAPSAFAQDWKAKYPELVFAIIPAENASGVVERYTPFRCANATLSSERRVASKAPYLTERAAG